MTEFSHIFRFNQKQKKLRHAAECCERDKRKCGSLRLRDCLDETEKMHLGSSLRLTARRVDETSLIRVFGEKVLALSRIQTQDVD